LVWGKCPTYPGILIEFFQCIINDPAKEFFTYIFVKTLSMPADIPKSFLKEKADTETGSTPARQ